MAKTEQKDKEYEGLKLENQICFPLYACSKEIIRAYKPFLDEIDLTYTQYITMMVLWEKKEMNVKTLGENLFLDSGTLTPVLKKLESKGFLKRTRSKSDERNLLVSITKEGEALKEKAKDVPEKIGKCVCLDSDDAKELYRLLYKVIENIR
ncbi:MAG: MarR family transcriptional regulator [Butyrivibrio sp.]|nr:MarR family transcriptional regulator [Butyrivibrio sp.]